MTEAHLIYKRRLESQVLINLTLQPNLRDWPIESTPDPTLFETPCLNLKRTVQKYPDIFPGGHKFFHIYYMYICIFNKF